MNIEELQQYCLIKSHVTEEFPFGDQTLVYKVAGKIFALSGLDNADFQVNLKCDPEYAVELREQYPDAVIPGYHMNKKHWNTIFFESGLSDNLLKSLVDHSYELVVQSFPKYKRDEILSS